MLKRKLDDVKEDVNDWRQEREVYKTLENTAYKNEKEAVRLDRIDRKAEEAQARGKAKAHRTGLPGPRVSPATKERVKKGIKNFKNNLDKAVEKQHNSNTNPNNNDETNSKPLSAEDRMKEFDENMKKMMG